MKRIIVLLMTVCLICALFAVPAAAQDAEEPDLKDYQEYLWELSDDLSDEEFALYSLRNYKFIQSLEPIVDPDSFKALYKANVHVKQKADGARQEFLDAQNNLIMLSSVKDSVYFLWDIDNMASAPEDAALTEEDLDAAPLDGVGFIPFLIKCLADDPAQAKGNLIVIAGGGGSNRSNSHEAYAAVPVFNELGYNVFVLQYRIAPYDSKDMLIDTQRAIRVVRYYAEKEGWGGQDMIAACGWSAGGHCVMGTICSLYGSVLPDIYDPEYVPDEIDQVSSDLDVGLPIYGPGIDEGTENPNIPALFCCIGEEDNNGADVYYNNPYKEAINRGIPAVLYIMEGAGHGFGVGTEGAKKATVVCSLWPYYADEFMMANKGHSAGTAPTAEYPEKTMEECILHIDDYDALLAKLQEQ